MTETLTPLDALIVAHFGPIADAEVEARGIARAGTLQSIRRGSTPRAATVAKMGRFLGGERVVRVAVEQTIAAAKGPR